MPPLPSERSGKTIPPVDKFIARQPIFDLKRNVFAYELLFRSGPENFFSGIDGDLASSRLIDDSLHVFGIDALIGSTKAFINVTRRILVEELLTTLPPERVVAEILETVTPDAEVVAAAEALKKGGYMLALDDFVAHPDMEPLLKLADIVKVDFRATTGQERRDLIMSLAKRGIDVLAEKVETEADVREAIVLGCIYFQGYFFCKPEMIARKDVPGFKLNYMRLLTELGRPELDFAGIERVLKGDISLAGKLLKYLNSASFGWRQQVTTLQHALVLLGERQFRKWASLVALATMSQDRPPELAKTSLTRARFCELAASDAGLAGQELDAFLLGMFSLVDAIVGRPLDEILNEIALPDEVSKALLHKNTRLSKLLDLSVAMERGNWEEVSSLASALKMDESRFPDFYQTAIAWVTEILEGI